MGNFIHFGCQARDEKEHVRLQRDIYTLCDRGGRIQEECERVSCGRGLELVEAGIGRVGVTRGSY